MSSILVAISYYFCENNCIKLKDMSQNHFCLRDSLLYIFQVVVGVDGILSAYSIACTDVVQSRPIQFSGVVNRAVDIVSASPHKKYYVLLIITVRTLITFCFLTLNLIETIGL